LIHRVSVFDLDRCLAAGGELEMMSAVRRQSAGDVPRRDNT